MERNLNDLAVFCEVAQAGSLTAAAARLGLPKSTVSRRLARLETRLQTRLLNKSTRKLSLTEAGLALWRRAAEALDELLDAERQVEAMQSEVAGRLRLASPIDIGVNFLAGAVSRFQLAHPAVEIEVELGNRRFDPIEEGFDVVLRVGPQPDSTAVARRLTGLRRHLYASPALLERAPAPQHPDELVHLPALWYTASLSANWTLTRAGERAEVEPASRLSANSVAFLREALAAGQGVALLPDFLCAADVASGRLVRVLPAWDGLTYDLWAVMPSRRFVPGRTRLFLDYLVAWFEAADMACQAPAGVLSGT